MSVTSDSAPVLKKKQSVPIHCYVTTQTVAIVAIYQLVSGRDLKYRYNYVIIIMQSSLTCQFEHSGKVRSGLIGNFISIAIRFGLISSVLR